MKQIIGVLWVASTLSFVCVAGCGGSFGYAVERRGEHGVIENLGTNRYVYSVTTIAHAPPRGPAMLALSPPTDLDELARIDVTVQYSGWGADGLRTQPDEFFPMLASLAGELGATRFVVFQTSHAGAWPQINAIVAGAYGHAALQETLPAEPIHPTSLPSPAP